MRKKQSKKRALIPDPRFNDQLVTRFVNNLMLQGKKSTAYKVFYDAIDIVESKKGSIDLSLKALDSNISGNSNHLENIIINILDNAVKYSKENPKIVVSSTNINKDIRLCFEDNGIGMDKNTQKLIFEKFYREQNGDIHNIKGHGLGLSYVKKIIDFHNGKILLESKKGTGTKFYITLKNI